MVGDNQIMIEVITHILLLNRKQYGKKKLQ